MNSVNSYELYNMVSFKKNIHIRIENGISTCTLPYVKQMTSASWMH